MPHCAQKLCSQFNVSATSDKGDDDRVRVNENIRYEPEENPPHPLSAGLGFQATLTLLPPIVVIVALIVRAADQPESYLNWAVFSAMVISGAITVLQSMRLGRFGSGHMLFVGTSSTFLIVCVLALESGGPSLMATLVVLSSVLYFLLAWRLSLLRRVITPLVSGVVIMLLAAMAAPIVFGMLAKVPESTPLNCRSHHRRGNTRRHSAYRAPCPTRMAALGASHRSSRRLRCFILLWPLRLRERRRSILGRLAGTRLAWL